MEIRHLECFAEVVRLNSFSKAAQALHISQPAVSKMIRAMEDELELPLLYRHSRSVELTDVGRAVFARAQQMASLFRSLHAELEDVRQLRAGRLRIGLPPIASSSVFPRVLGEFSRRYPEIAIELCEAGSKTIEKRVTEGTLDLGVVCSLPPRGELAVLPFIRDPLQVIIAPDHPLARKGRLRFSDLAQERFVMYREDFSLHDAIRERCRAAGFEPHSVYETSQREFMTQMVAAGLGIALLPQAICDTLDPAHIRPLPLEEPPLYLHLAAIWRRDRYLSFAARCCLSFTANELGAPPPQLPPAPAPPGSNKKLAFD